MLLTTFLIPSAIPVPLDGNRYIPWFDQIGLVNSQATTSRFHCRGPSASRGRAEEKGMKRGKTDRRVAVCQRARKLLKPTSNMIRGEEGDQERTKTYFHCYYHHKISERTETLPSLVILT